MNDKETLYWLIKLGSVAVGVLRLWAEKYTLHD